MNIKIHPLFCQILYWLHVASPRFPALVFRDKSNLKLSFGRPSPPIGIMLFKYGPNYNVPTYQSSMFYSNTT